MELPHLLFETSSIGGDNGVQCRYKNWSIIYRKGSYGYEQGLYEVMGPSFNDGDVEGYLTLPEIMFRIALYEAKNPA